MEGKNYVAIFSENVEGKYTINRYYFVINGEKYRVDGENLKILKTILKDFECRPGKNNPKIYTQFDEIMNCFRMIDAKRKIQKLKQKKVNRRKSRTIRVGVLVLAIVVLTSLSAMFMKNKRNNTKNGNHYTVGKEVDNNQGQSDIYVTKYGVTIYEDTTLESDDLENSTEVILETDTTNEDDVLIFEYESDETIDRENIENALRYKDLFVKYGDMYGIPWQLLCAMAAQENMGEHNIDYSEPAIGIMQIERNALIGHTFNKIYNFKTNSFEKFTITNSNRELEDINYNIKCGAIELADCIRVSYNIAVKEGKIDIKEGIAYPTQRYNFGIKNMIDCLNGDNNWMDNRSLIKTGDNRYFEKVFDGVQQLGCDTICVKYYDEEAKEVREVKTKIVNTYNKKFSK